MHASHCDILFATCFLELHDCLASMSYMLIHNDQQYHLGKPDISCQTKQCIVQVASCGAAMIRKRTGEQQQQHAIGLWDPVTQRQSMSIPAPSGAPAAQAQGIFLQAESNSKGSVGSYITIWQPLNPSDLPPLPPDR